MEHPYQQDGWFQGGGGDNSPRTENQVRRQIKCDKFVIIDGIKFSVNSTVLATQSSFFETMFISGMKETNESEVILKDPRINPNGFRDWLAEIYLPGSVELTTENILDVWKVANFTQSHWVLLRCKSTINALVSSYSSYSTSIKEFVISVYSLAYLFDDASLQDLTRGFVSDNVSEALHNSEFQRAIGGAKLLKILKAHDLTVMSEEELFLGIMDWVNFDVIAREPFLVDMLKLVHLHFVPAAILRQHLYNDKFMNNKQYLDIYIDALHCHAIEEVKATRPRRPRYQRYSIKENKFLVTFRYGTLMYYEHEEDKWQSLPGCDYPRGQITKCTSTLTTIYALVKSTVPYDASDYCPANILVHRNELWVYSSQINEWKLYGLPTSEPDDLVYLQGTLYVMENKRMWKAEAGQWVKCESCAHNCTTSFAFGKYIMRFGRSASRKTFYCSFYDVNKMTYTEIRYRMPKPIIVQKPGVQSVLMIDGSVYDWHKWAKYCISNDEIMDSTSGADFLIPQDGIPLQQSERKILLKNKLHYVVGQTLFLPNTNSDSVCRNITNIKKKHSILPGDKNIAFVSLSRECFLNI